MRKKFNFKEWLINCGYTYEEAAEALGVSVPVVKHFAKNGILYTDVGELKDILKELDEHIGNNITAI